MKGTTALPPVTESVKKCPNCDTERKTYVSLDGRFTTFGGYHDGDRVCIMCIGCDCRAPFAIGIPDAIIEWNTAARAKNLIRIEEDDTIAEGDGGILCDSTVAEEG